MTNWKYTNENGEKVTVTGGQLKWLAKYGKITPETILETENGKTAPARKVKGLEFMAAATPAEDTYPLAESPSPEPVKSVPPPHVDNSKPDPLPPLQEESRNRFKSLYVYGACIAGIVVIVAVLISVFTVISNQSKVRELVKNDMRDVSKYAAQNDTENATKLVNSRRVEHFEDWQKTADKGLPEGQFLIGWCHYFGAGVLLDKTLGGSWFRKAAEQGLVEGQYWCGIMYSEGTGVPEDKAEAAKWFQKAAEQGNCDAQEILGTYYLEGEGVPKDTTEAVKWFSKAAEQGSLEAPLTLAKIYHEGEGIAADQGEAVKWLRMAADKGHAAAQTMLGQWHSQGDGVPVDKEEAVKWFQKAASQGDAEAQYQLGECYRLGEGGLEADVTVAKQWFRKASSQGHKQARSELWSIESAENKKTTGTSLVAKLKAVDEYYDEREFKRMKEGAEQGYPSDCHELAACYEFGRNVPKDMTEAIRWYQRAAQGSYGYSDSAFRLANIYYKGEGVPKDNYEAVKWLSTPALRRHRGGQMLMLSIINEEKPKLLKRAEEGDAVSQCQLGVYYLEGQFGFPVNNAEAVKWFRQSADQDNAEACMQLAKCYYTAKGVEKDKEEAIYWADKAIEFGHPEAREYKRRFL